MKLSWKRWLVLSVNVVLLALVVWGIGSRMMQHLDELGRHGEVWDDFRPSWLVLAGVLYLLGTLPCALFWRRMLVHLGSQPKWFDLMRAYYIGHLGKYIPSKAMVVVLRIWFLRGQVPASVAGVGVFYETLTMMAVGGLISGLILLIYWNQHWFLVLLAIGLTLGAGVPVFPPIFLRLAQLAQIGKANPDLVERLREVPVTMMLRAMAEIALGWALLGTSLIVTIYALSPELASHPADYPIFLAAVGLSLVAGFMSLLPGGIGIREWVLMELLTPIMPVTYAIVIPILLRLVWLLAEASFSAILYVCPGGSRQSTEVWHEPSTQQTS